MPCPTTESARSATTFPNVIRISSDAGDTVRCLPVWSIAEVLDFDDQVDAVLAVTHPTEGPTPGVDPGLLDDLIASRLIAPPRCRRRRDRAVSSRAVFYQAGA
jgi:hypothetical protein